MNGPAKSTDTLSNTRDGSFNLMSGRGAIFCLALFAFRRAHLTYSFSISRISSQVFNIQYLFEIIDKRWFVPAAWLFTSWYLLTISLVTWCFLGNTIGKHVSYVKYSAYLILVSERNIPSSSMNGDNSNSLLVGVYLAFVCESGVFSAKCFLLTRGYNNCLSITHFLWL